VAESTEQLIARLTADAEPVERLRPPFVRAAGWLGAVALIAILGVIGLADFEEFRQRARNPMVPLEIIAAALTGIASVIAAFQLSLPDRSSWWALLPVPFLAVWLADSGYNCWRNWIEAGPTGWELGDSAHCFAFIVTLSVPLGVSLWWVLARALPLAPGRVAALGGLGIAALAAALLQFFHPFDITFIDLGVHALTVALVVAVSSISARRSAAFAAA